MPLSVAESVCQVPVYLPTLNKEWDITATAAAAAGGRMILAQSRSGGVGDSFFFVILRHISRSLTICVRLLGSSAHLFEGFDALGDTAEGGECTQSLRPDLTPATGGERDQPSGGALAGEDATQPAAVQTDRGQRAQAELQAEHVPLRRQGAQQHLRERGVMLELADNHTRTLGDAEDKPTNE